MYNKRDTIARAINSVLAQTVQAFEVVVVDDGSTDDGGEVVVRSYTDPRIRLVRQKNQGVSSARNHGVDVAQAELIAFLDADDEWLPEFLETILQLREKYSEAGLYCTNWCFTQDGKENRLGRFEPISCGLAEGVLSSSSYFHHVALHGEVNITSCTVIPKKIIQRFGGFNPQFIMHEDLDLWDKIGYHYNVAYSEKPLALYHVESSNMVQRVLKNYETMRLPFVDYFHFSLAEEKKQRCDYADVCLYLESLHIREAWIWKFVDERSKARECLRGVHRRELMWRKWKCWFGTFSVVEILYCRFFQRR